jgi:hypothetical protein
MATRTTTDPSCLGLIESLNLVPIKEAWAQAPLETAR